jgi:hypothetical protein
MLLNCGGMPAKLSMTSLVQSTYSCPTKGIWISLSFLQLATKEGDNNSGIA